MRYLKRGLVINSEGRRLACLTGPVELRVFGKRVDCGTGTSGAMRLT